MDLLQIDLDKILRAHMSPTMNRLVPRAATRMLERIVCQQQLNEILRAIYPAEGSEFSRKILEYQDIKVKVKGVDNLDPTARYAFASNHPLGGLDGIALIAVLGEIYGDERLCFLVNDLLMNITPLQSVFLPINKYGSQGREAARAINEAYASVDKQILVFPAGLVSRKQKGGIIKDLEWKKAFVQKALQSERQIVPLRFVGRNTDKFYNTARWRTRLRIPINIEQALLPSELVKARGNRFEVHFGNPIPIADLHRMVTTQGLNATAAHIQDLVYTL